MGALAQVHDAESRHAVKLFVLIAAKNHLGMDK
jgi:hypothetical protein